MADNYNIYAIHNGETIELTFDISDFSWTESVKDLSITLSFSMLKNQKINLGNGIVLTNNNIKIFEGVIIDIQENFEIYSVTCRDYGFYLNKSETIKQFKNVSASDCLKAIFKENNIAFLNIPNMPTRINGIFKGSISKIVKKILETVNRDSGKIYYIEMLFNKIHVYEKNSIKINPLYELEITGEMFPCNKLIIKDYSKKITIDDIVNKVLIYSNKKKRLNIKEIKQDRDSIKKYGVIQKILKLNEKDQAETRNSALKILRESSTPKQKLNITLLGNDDIKAGRVINISDETIGVSDDFNIISCTHTYENRVHKTNIELEVV